MPEPAGGKRGELADKVCVGMITGAHGIKGAVTVKSYTAEATNIGAYAPLTDEAGGHVFRLEFSGRTRGQLIARIEGVDSREAAEALAGLPLYVERASLPPVEIEDEFYQTDLIGLEALLADGRTLGTVVGVHNFGAGDLLEIAVDPDRRDRTVMVPFTPAAVPDLDIGAGRMTVDPLAAGLEDAADDPERDR